MLPGATSKRGCTCCGMLQDSKGVFAAREFVWWYNGHPDQQQLPVDLSKVESVAVCGIGNVALDCARVLLRPVAELASTDIARHALQQLRSSKVREVLLCARRGPVQVSVAVQVPVLRQHSLELVRYCLQGRYSVGHLGCSASCWHIAVHTRTQ